MINAFRVGYNSYQFTLIVICMIARLADYVINTNFLRNHLINKIRPLNNMDKSACIDVWEVGVVFVFKSRNVTFNILYKEVDF